MASASSYYSDFKFNVSFMNDRGFIQIFPIVMVKCSNQYVFGRDLRYHVECILGDKIRLFQYSAVTTDDKVVVDIHCAFQFADEDGKTYRPYMIRNVVCNQVTDNECVLLAGDKAPFVIVEKFSNNDSDEVFTSLR